MIPARSTVWGSIPFGIENPGRVQLVQLADALIILERARTLGPVPVTTIAPDYLVWGYPETRENTIDALRSMVRHHAVLFRRLGQELAETPFKLVGMVTAPPYGTTRVFARGETPPGASSDLPIVASYDPVHATWDRRVDGPIASPFVAVQPPVSFAVDDGSLPTVSANRSVRGDLPAGRYLLRVHVNRSEEAARRLLAVSTSTEVHEVITELGPRGDFAPYGSYDRDAFLMHEHPGGPVFVSQFDNGRGAAISGVEVYLIRPAVADGPAAVEVPALGEWARPTAGVQVTVTATGALAVRGDNSPQGYQIRGRAVPASPGARVTLRAAVAAEQGSICLGALNGVEEKWLVNGVPPGGELTFEVDDTGGFVFVVYNCRSSQANATVPSRFTLSSAGYRLQHGLPYVDRLIALGAGPRRLHTAPVYLLVTPDDLDRATPIAVGDMEEHAASATSGPNGWTISGAPARADIQLLRAKPADAAAGAWLIAQGVVKTGGLRIGVLENGEWVRSVDVTNAGAFIAVVEVPRSGRYAAVVANRPSDPAQPIDLVVAPLSWRPPPLPRP